MHCRPYCYKIKTWGLPHVCAPKKAPTGLNLHPVIRNKHETIFKYTDKSKLRNINPKRENPLSHHKGSKSSIWNETLQHVDHSGSIPMVLNPHESSWVSYACEVLQPLLSRVFCPCPHPVPFYQHGLPWAFWVGCLWHLCPCPS